MSETQTNKHKDTKRGRKDRWMESRLKMDIIIRLQIFGRREALLVRFKSLK